jgi:hypothetical protein
MKTITVKKIPTIAILAVLLFGGFASMASAQEIELRRVAFIGFDSGTINERTIGAGQVTEIIKRKIEKIYGVIPAIVVPLIGVPPIEVPAIEIPRRTIGAGQVTEIIKRVNRITGINFSPAEIPTVEIPTVEIPTVEIPTVEIPTVEIPVV